MAELLLELFCEEIPARMQSQAADDVKTRFSEMLSKAGINDVSMQVFATPRRLALIASNLPQNQPDRNELRRGPREGAPEKALEGFIRSAGVTKDALEIEETNKGRFYVAKIQEKGRPIVDIISESIPILVRSFPWPKSMRWGDGELKWVRPLHSVICLLDGRVVPFEIEGIKSGAATRGHRFMAPDIINVKGASDYKQALASAHVMLDASERQDVIETAAHDLSAKVNAEVIEDRGLLAEVAGLVEWPVPLMGEFEEDFLNIPPEVLTSTMRTNQKYFALRDVKSGKLINKFILVSNLVARDGGRAITAGNERVLAARLSDAKFFWDQDLKISLKSRFSELENIVFHAKLGSQAARVKRLEKLSVEIAAMIGADKQAAKTAAQLCKADLVSGVVGEFPEVQGVMGGYLARHETLSDEIADAIAEHYKPVGPTDIVPDKPVSVVIALADKIDILAGFWAIDEKPTGSKDPYALRRAALGIIRLILSNELRLSLRACFASAAKGYGKPLEDQVSADGLLAFFAERLKVHLREQGARHDLVDAVFALGGDDLVSTVRRIDALGRFLATEDGANLLSGYRRAANILRIEEKKDGKSYPASVNKSQLTQIEEKELAEAIELTRKDVDKALAKEDFEAAMSALSSLRAPVDAFFDKVTVNAKEKPVRENRLCLLSAIRSAIDGIADFSRIEG